MPIAGDSFRITLKKAHLEWGTYRHTSSRNQIYGEGYLPIPAQNARQFNIYNKFQPGANPIYNCSSIDGFLSNVELLAAGNSVAQAVHAKQFHGNGNLKLLGDWFYNVNAHVGDTVEIVFTAPNSMTIELI